MTQIHNTDLFKEVRDGIKSQQLRDNIPQQLGNTIVPVMEVNPKLLRRINVVRQTSSSSTGSLIAYTTEANKDFFLTGIQACYVKDAACDIATGTINVNTVIDGATRSLCNFPVITLTAQSQNIDREFPIPIKVDRGQNISISGAFTAGVCVRTISIIGYNVENPNA